MFTCFAFNLLFSEIGCPATLKICSDGTDVLQIERYFLQAWIQGASTQMFTFSIMKTDRKLISENHHNNNDKVLSGMGYYTGK